MGRDFQASIPDQARVKAEPASVNYYAGQLRVFPAKTFSNPPSFLPCSLLFADNPGHASRREPLPVVSKISFSHVSDIALFRLFMGKLDLTTLEGGNRYRQAKDIEMIELKCERSCPSGKRRPGVPTMH